jgi:hypothetical protein
MKLAIMQPYLFPYLGYFHLCHAADEFVFYDDVSYRKGGYINRNTILSSGKELMFTVPVKDASPNRKIVDIMLGDSFGKFKNKFMKTLKQSYSKSVGFDLGMSYVEDVLSCSDSISKMCERSIEGGCSLLGVDTSFCRSSDVLPGREEKAQDAVISICKHLGASGYVNLSGGRSLYDTDSFNEEGISLEFVSSSFKDYGNPTCLSVIDVIMNVEEGELAEYASTYTLVQ